MKHGGHKHRPAAPEPEAAAPPKPVSLLDKLNALPILSTRKLAIEKCRRQGSMFVVETNKGAIVWPSALELIDFRKSQALVAESTYELLRVKGNAKSQWEPAAAAILRLASENAEVLEHHLKEECRDWLRLVWEEAGSPVAYDNEDFIRFIEKCRTTPRDLLQKTPPCVFIEDATQRMCLRPSTFRRWISLSSMTGRDYPLQQLRVGLGLLGCSRPESPVTRRDGDRSCCERLWFGDKAILVD
jgi:hypothetical protein